MSLRRTLHRLRRRAAPSGDRGVSMIETVSALVLVSALFAAVAAINPGNPLHDGIRNAVCLVAGPECEGESWVELEDTNPPIRRPVTFSSDIPEGSVANEANRELGMRMATERWNGQEARCLDELWQRESAWDHTAVNSSSMATGIPQLLPAKHDVPNNWNDPRVQINWGLDYIARRYGTPCEAWEFWQNPEDSPAGASAHWY